MDCSIHLFKDQVERYTQIRIFFIHKNYKYPHKIPFQQILSSPLPITILPPPPHPYFHRSFRGLPQLICSKIRWQDILSCLSALLTPGRTENIQNMCPCEFIHNFTLHRTNLPWRFRKILWPSLNIWTLNKKYYVKVKKNLGSWIGLARYFFSLSYKFFYSIF